MRPSELKKDLNKSIRINSDVVTALDQMGYDSIQKFLDEKLDESLTIEIVNNSNIFIENE